MKRIVSIMLVSVMVLSMFPVTAQAATDGYYTYTVKDGNAVITDVDYSISGDVIVPDKFVVDRIGEYPVTEIGDYAFEDCDNITSVVIPKGVTIIGEKAFWDCNALTDVTIPNSVVTISYCAFQYTPLSSLHIPSSVRTIGEYAFNDCNSLKNVTLSEGLLTISDGTFQNCDLLEYIKIPSTVEYIGWSAFESCDALTEVIIPYGVTEIRWYAFKECPKLQTVTIFDSVTSIDGEAFLWSNPNLIIMCFDESPAEKFAEEQGFVCKYISRDITEPVYGITLSTALETYHAENATFTASDLSETIEGIEGIEFDHTVYSMVYKVDGTPTSLESGMTLSMPIPQGYSGQNCKIYLVENGQTTEKIETTYLPDEKVLKFSVADPNATFAIVNETIPGDANSDSLVNITDAILIAKNIIGYADAEIDSEAADVTGDGIVNIVDAITIVRYIVGHPVELL